MSSGKLFQTAGSACEKARSSKTRLVRSSCSRFLPQDRSWREGISKHRPQLSPDYVLEVKVKDQGHILIEVCGGAGMLKSHLLVLTNRAVSGSVFWYK